MNPIELGKFIAKLRNEKKITQEELAEKLYIDKRKISRWECGTSVPEFDMLIKLSEILNVSLYELSICKRIEKEKLTRKIINKFKTAKDYKRYNTKKIIKQVLLVILFILFIFFARYTVKYNNTVEIFELNSLDDKYYIEGNYVYAKNFNLFYIEKFYIKTSNNSLKNCEYEVYDNDIRLLHITNDNKARMDISRQTPYYEVKRNKKTNNIINLQVKCTNNKKTNTYKFNVNLTKIYSNKII